MSGSEGVAFPYTYDLHPHGSVSLAKGCWATSTTLAVEDPLAFALCVYWEKHLPASDLLPPTHQ